MIIVSTGKSPIELILDAYAQSFVKSLSGGSAPITAHLRSPASKAVQVQTLLSSKPNVGLYFFGHGLKPPSAGFQADDGEPAVDQTNIKLLSGRTVVATCCFGDQIGKLAQDNQFSLFGYEGGLYVPSHPHHVQDTETAALAGPRAIASGASPQAAAKIARIEFRRLQHFLYNRNQPGDRPYALLAGINATIANAW
ncbi:MAG: hypothetical protein JOZ29_17975 [Deltaproteobacteria bacterium]|nr:hypothetical protein [Deltaproteobacteria bacterium]